MSSSIDESVARARIRPSGPHAQQAFCMHVCVAHQIYPSHTATIRLCCYSPRTHLNAFVRCMVTPQHSTAATHDRFYLSTATCELAACAYNNVGTYVCPHVQPHAHAATPLRSAVSLTGLVASCISTLYGIWWRCTFKQHRISFQGHEAPTYDCGLMHNAVRSYMTIVCVITP